MKLTNDIVPAISLGGIALQTSIDDVIDALRSHRVLEVFEGIVSIDNGLITVGYDEGR